MRLDKYLKVSRLVKRRTLAKEVADKDVLRLMGKLLNQVQRLKLAMS